MTAPIIENNYTGDGSTVLFSFTFEYIEATDIEVSIDNVTIATTEYSLANSTTIEFTTAPANGTAVRIYRNTTVNEPKATFFPGSAIRAQDLNDNFEQILFVTQEADAISERAETAADAAQTATTTAQAAADSANTAGAAAQASATAAQASATAAQTSASAAAADASQASTDAASAVATANTASTNASNAVTTANAASALISTAVLADGTRAMSGDLNVDSNKVVNLANPTAGGDAVNKSFADANYQPLDAELTELATMQNTTASALADLTQAEVLVLDGATLSTAELNTLDGITATTSELNTLDGITSTVGELNVLDGVTATTTELNITDGLTASTAELNQLDGKTISNVLTPANNNDIPTSSAVNTYVSGLLNALGGFVAIANESSFPTTNPDPSDNAGTVVSITDAGGLVVDSSGNSTSARTTGNATVTITGFPSSLHSTTLGNDLGLQVQTTSTLNTYTYHKLIAKESDVVRLSDDINDFNERYRVSASAPTTDLDAGDLWFDTTAGKMKVYDANDSAWEEVQSVGNFFINTLSSSSSTGGGSATFDGSAYRFTLSNAGANAQQMLVSINGVIQKPNSGTSQPSEGFAIDTNDIIFAAAPASGASHFIVTIGSSVNIGQPSNNTVDTSELVDGAVTNAKVSSSAAIASSKINFSNIAVTGSVTCDQLLAGDNDKIQLGDAQDFRIYHDGSLNIIDGHYHPIEIKHQSEIHIKCVDDGSVGLYHNNNKKLETKSDGIDVTGEVQCDTLDVDGAASFTGGDVDFNGASYQAFWDYSKSALRFQDNAKCNFGTSEDLKIYHDSTNSYIENQNGDLYVQTTGSGDDVIIQAVDDVFIKPRTGENGIQVLGDGAVKLAYNSDFKFETLSNGVRVQGGVLFGSDTADANALSDYEEGTWTVSLYDAVSGGNQSSTTQTGSYTKVGRIVNFEFDLVNVSASGLTGTNAAYFNLPFASASGWGAPVAMVLIRGANWAGTTRTSVTSWMGAGDSRFRIYLQGDNTDYEALRVNELVSNVADFYISGTYATT